MGVGDESPRTSKVELAYAHVPTADAVRNEMGAPYFPMYFANTPVFPQATTSTSVSALLAADTAQ